MRFESQLAGSNREKPRVRLESQARWILGAAAVLAGLGLGLWRWHSQRRIEHSQDDVILAAAARYGVDAGLVKAVVWRESGFNPNARGRAGEIGLMQITDAAAQEWAESAGVYPLPESHLFNPRTNLLAGTWYLGKLLRRYAATDDPRPFALADYNAGRANALKWMQGDARYRAKAFRSAIGFESTRRYVDAVLARRSRYAR
jgi:soluble lytic murein transglycosylase